MAIEWIICKLQDGGKNIHLNMTNAHSVVEFKKGSKIWFPAGVEEDCIDVIETPEEIFEQLREVRYVGRA